MPDAIRDYSELLADAITHVPPTQLKNMMIRCDGAGASHGLLTWRTAQNQVKGRGVEYSIGSGLTNTLRDAIALEPQSVWTAAIVAVFATIVAIPQPA
ncbi:hypothetical protein JT358_09275 [Micrococcales bacterium 31B]|nr:hypothetical protein [Micrococcales bacterium 31B]